MLQEHTFQYDQPFELESGSQLPGFQLRYHTLGTLNEQKDNVIWVCHALTGNSKFTEWWPYLFGKGRLYDPDEYFIVCANMLGSCYGSTNPLSVDPNTGTPYYHTFPKLTNRDMVRSFQLLKMHLGITQLHTIIGGSMGGQHALEWCIMFPEEVKHLIQVASNARHSPWGIAFNEAQRMAIEHDSTWQASTPDAGMKGLRAARAMALLSYRHYRTYEKTQREETDEKLVNFRASSYQRYQGEKLVRRFNAYSYWVLSESMDSHNVGRGRGGIVPALQQIRAHCLFVGVKTDILFPPEEQEFIAQHVADASLAIIDSDYGHDGFLLEIPELNEIIMGFYQKNDVSHPEV